jgi:hypothetical protein
VIISEINLFNVLHKQRLTKLPPHFLPVIFEIKAKPKDISDWIFEHLQGRFYFSDRIINENGISDIKYCAAFENHSEATYFSLILPEINQKKY